MAWSGGLDSTVLLHRLVAARRAAPGTIKLRAVHVDHHLQAASQSFVRHCRKVARSLRVELAVLDVRVPTGPGISVEEAARDARYAVLGAVLRPGELLLTAQHADDQFETVLLALLRGAGPAGLAGMAEAVEFGPGRLLRPLLGETRESLETCAREAGLVWIEDPTNPDPRFDRNFLRGHVQPLLRTRWPGLAGAAVRSARLCAQAARLARDTARHDADLAADGHALEAAVLRRLSPMRAAGAVRAWLADHGARMPDERRLLAILGMLEVRADATPQVGWGPWQVRLYQGRLHLAGREPPAPQVPGPQMQQKLWSWREHPRLALAGHGELALRKDARGDLDLDRLPEQLQVHAHVAGRAAPAFAGQRRLRKLFQQLAVPASGRGALPLVSAPGEAAAEPRLLAIADLWLDPALRVTASTRNAGRFVWRRPA